MSYDYRRTEAKLHEYAFKRASILNLLDQLQEIDEDRLTLEGVDYERTPTDSNDKTSIIERKLIAHEKQRQAVANKIIRIERQVRQVDRALDLVQPIERQILEMWYFEQKPWQYIEEKLGMSERWMRKLRKKAVRQVATALFGGR